MVGYREITETKNVHAYEGINLSMKGQLRDPHHGKHDPVGKTDIDQVAAGDARSAANSYVRRSN